jgi:hypothetical protein
MKRAIYLDAYLGETIELSKLKGVKNILAKPLRKRTIVKSRLVEARDMPNYMPRRTIKKMREQGYTA